jgi:hypothetical protein
VTSESPFICSEQLCSPAQGALQPSKIEFGLAMARSSRLAPAATARLQSVEQESCEGRITLPDPAPCTWMVSLCVGP